MSKTKHTDLPWLVNTQNAVVYAKDLMGRSCTIADCCTSNAPDDDEEQLANARLIARACNCHNALLTALLELLSEHNNHCEGGHDHPNNDTSQCVECNAARAIALAERW